MNEWVTLFNPHNSPLGRYHYFTHVAQGEHRVFSPRYTQVFRVWPTWSVAEPELGPESVCLAHPYAPSATVERQGPVFTATLMRNPGACGEKNSRHGTKISNFSLFLLSNLLLQLIYLYNGECSAWPMLLPFSNKIRPCFTSSSLFSF